jgi:dGTPase
VHSTAFRRLVYKTQVFVNHEGDLFRTRLTHTLEVAQLGRSIARGLGLHEDLVEAIALAHDLGHTPFGHAGQDALHDCMQAHGGFEHNLQSLRVVDGWRALPGVRRPEPQLRDARGHPQALQPARCARWMLPSPAAWRAFPDGTQPSLEAQLCNLADEIAYNAHDIDDGVRSGCCSSSSWPSCRWCATTAMPRWPNIRRWRGGQPGRRLLFETIRRMLSAQVHDVIDATQAALTAGFAGRAPMRPGTCPALLRHSDTMHAEGTALKRFLFSRAVPPPPGDAHHRRGPPGGA